MIKSGGAFQQTIHTDTPWPSAVPKVVVYQNPPGGAPAVWHYKGLDPFGREYAAYSSGRSSQSSIIAASKVFDARGNVHGEVAPTYTDTPVYDWTIHRYDGLNRRIRTDHPDGTAVTLQYLLSAAGFETVKATDEIGRDAIVYKDAFNRIDADRTIPRQQWPGRRYARLHDHGL